MSGPGDDVTMLGLVSEVFCAAKSRVQSQIEAMHSSLGSTPMTILGTVLIARMCLFPSRFLGHRNTLLLRESFKRISSRGMRYSDMASVFRNSEFVKAWQQEASKLGANFGRSSLPLLTHIPTFWIVGTAIRDAQLTSLGFDYLPYAVTALNAVILKVTNDWMSRGKVTWIYLALQASNLLSLQLVYSHLSPNSLFYLLCSAGISFAEVALLHRTKLIRQLILFNK